MKKFINSKSSVANIETIKETVEEFSFQPRILVVDDEERVRQVCQRFFHEEGCVVKLSENGINCLKMIAESHFDIILLDIMMPGISGFDVLKKVKSLHPDTVVIIITGYATLEHSIEAMKNGAFDFLSKPFSPQDLRIVTSKAIKFIQTLQDIATEKSRMRVMINSLYNGVLTTDNQKRVALANPAFLKLMGCRKNRRIGQPVSELIKNNKLLDMIDEAIRQPKDKFVQITDEITISDPKENKDTVLGVRCVPFRDRVGRNLGTVTLLQDITALKKIDQLKSDFVSMVAHELKSPLNSILAQLNVVLDGLAGDLTDKQKDILSRIYKKTQSLAMLSTDLLDLSKIESGLINQEQEEFDLKKLMMDQVDFYREKAVLKSIKIKTDASDKNIQLLGNKTHIEEVFSNLISNAIRYTPDGGIINVSIETKNDCTVIQVSDTGFGIPKKEVAKIFNKFYRIKNEKTRYINGTGLGLSIVKNIVEAHHGSIKVDSKVNEGTTFKVYLPGSQYKL